MIMIFMSHALEHISVHVMLRFARPTCSEKILALLFAWADTLVSLPGTTLCRKKFVRHVNKNYSIS